MRNLVFFVAVLATALSAAQAEAAGQTSMTRSASITLHLHANVERAFPMFDPVNEMKWDPEWKPKLLGDRVEEGLVFLIEHDGNKSTWLIDRLDAQTHTIAYVVCAQNLLTRIHITVVPDGPQSVATVTYTRTALDDTAVAEVERFAAHFPSQAPHWESAINGYLDSASN